LSAQTAHKNAIDMDNPSMPWSLIGISDEARKIIRASAAESGQTIGQWLNDRILRAAHPHSPTDSSNTTGTSGEDQANQPAPAPSFTFDGQPTDGPAPAPPPPMPRPTP
jgi:hypothetical protein